MTCKDCGRDLYKLGEYVDFIHYRADRPNDRVPCMEDGDAFLRNQTAISVVTQPRVYNKFSGFMIST